MAKLEQILNGDFGQILKTIENGILNGSMSATKKQLAPPKSFEFQVRAVL